jgi:hypothetical protein
MSPPIILDNLKVSTPGGFPTETDVRLWAIRPTDQPHTRWFRIRSMATCGLPPTAKQPPSIGDTALRRLSLREVRPQLRADDAGSPSTIPTPNVSRVVEVLVEPILPFELALWTANSTTLASTGTWCVDSYDSRDPAKSNPDGTYPGRTSSKVQEHGHVASNLGRPADSIYGPSSPPMARASAALSPRMAATIRRPPRTKTSPARSPSIPRASATTSAAR